MKTKVKLLSAFAVLILLIGTLAGCGASDGDQQADGVTTVTVGTMGTYSPFSYYDEDGNITGYDIEVLKLVEKTDPSLHFEFISSAWDSLFPGLDSDKFQMLANQIASTEERLAKYYLTETGYHTGTTKIIVKGGRTDINSMEDLVGKTLGLVVADYHGIIAENWNEEHDNVLNIVYYEDSATILQDIENDRLDATLTDPTSIINKAEKQGVNIQPVGERLDQFPVFYIFKQDEVGADLRDRIDAALIKLKESGELSALSVEWFGDDYVN